MTSVVVADRGPGIPVEKRDQIFQAFTQADASATRPHEGLGIGLFLGRRVMDAHRGAIQVEDRPGGGSTFVLSFPSAGRLEGDDPRPTD